MNTLQNSALQTTINEVSIADVQTQAKRVAQVMGKIKKAMLAPQNVKLPPKFSTTDMAALCGVERQKVLYRLQRGDLPAGKTIGSRREWTLKEALAWVAEYKKDHKRPVEGANGVVITVANFKGGVAKTTSAVALAQGLSLRGHKVLVIDLDPQGSATTLFGYIPDTDVEREHTALPLFEGDEELIDYAIRKTYWEGIDLIGAAPMLFSAEFALPSRQMSNPGFEFWKVLWYGLDQVQRDYDVIIIDTPPALSYVTINALLAADGVIIPLPPNALDFASSSQFWDLFSDLCNNLYKNNLEEKKFAFIDVLLSKVETNDSASNVVRQWILEAYGEKVLPIEIPKTSIAGVASAEFGTIYDLTKNSVTAKTYTRAKDAYDRYVDLVEDQIRALWQKQYLSMKAFMDHAEQSKEVKV